MLFLIQGSLEILETIGKPVYASTLGVIFSRSNNQFKSAKLTYLIGIEVLHKAGNVRRMLYQSLFAEKYLLITNHKTNGLPVSLNISLW